MAEDFDKVLRLHIPQEKLDFKRLTDAAVVIDQDGMIIKSRDGMAGREATRDELDRAIDVYG